ncbi:MAG TPA: M23 family metallopeptidase [Nocardioides sp.]|nr:M23 family metallopeptidase [Nocardioides sp.]
MVHRALLLLAALPLLLASPAPTGHGVWPLPAPHDVVHGFDPPDSTYGPGHRGVDLAGHPGEIVRAALAGTVVFAGPLAGRGVVVVDHGSVRTTYEPVAASVHVGDPVAAGGAIGLLTLTQSHCFPVACLHWGLIRNSDDVYLDPLTLVQAAPIRLLPLWRELPWGLPIAVPLAQL